MRSIVALLLGLAEAVVGLLVVGASAYFPTWGFYSAACAQGSGGWAFASLMLLPLAFPLLGVVLFLAGVVVGLVGKPLHAGTSFWSWAKWLPLAAIGAGAAVWCLATITGAHARCSFGF